MLRARFALFSKNLLYATPSQDKENPRNDEREGEAGCLDCKDGTQTQKTPSTLPPKTLCLQVWQYNSQQNKDLFHQLPNIMQSNLPGSECIGRGYDIFGAYASPNSTTMQLFELGPENTLVSLGGDSYMGFSNNIASILRLDRTNQFTVYGQTISQYLDDNKVDLEIEGRYQAFSGSAKTGFSNEILRNRNYHFNTVRNTIEKYVIKLENFKTIPLKHYVHVDLNASNMEPEAIFRKYGTHFLREYVVGGRLDYFCATDVTKFKSTTTVSASAKASYSVLVGSISGSMSAEQKHEVEEFNRNSILKIQSIGGDTSESMKILSQNDSKEHFYRWFQSVNKSFVMCSFTQKSLAPIWELCCEEPRRNQLKSYFPVFASKNQLFEDIEKPIRINYTHSIIKCETDSGSGAKRDCVYYRPTVGTGEYWMGHFASPCEVGRALPVIFPIDKSLVAPPVGFQQAWDDQGSGKKLEYAIWNPIPPPDYVAMGCILRFRTHDCNPPPPHEVEGLVCVHKSVVSLGMAQDGHVVWSDAGTKANRDVSVWPIVPVDSNDGFAVDCFYASQKNEWQPPNPTYPQVYVLKKSKILNV